MHCYLTHLPHPQLQHCMGSAEEVERLRTIREREREIDCWSDSLACWREGCQGDMPRKVVDSLPCHSWTDLTDEKV